MALIQIARNAHVFGIISLLLTIPSPVVSAEASQDNLASVLCSTLASDPDDQLRAKDYAGVPRASTTEAAVTACDVALRAEPANIQLRYLYGRANLALGYYSVALSQLKQAAEGGYASAELSLGTMYEEGLGAARDQHAALTHFERASDLGDPSGLVNALRRYINADDVLPEMPDLLLKAGLAGSDEAWSMLNEIDKSHSDRFSGYDTEQALMQGLAAGRVEAGVELGRYYNRHDNATAARAVFELMAVRENREAMMALADLATGADRLGWLEKAARLGEPKAMYNLALDYKDGADGIAADPAAYENWLALSAQAGYLDAMTTLGYELLYSDPADYEGARSWFELAVEKGSSGAALGLAYIYEAGNGVPADADKAMGYYTAAIDGGEGTYAHFYRSLLEDQAGPHYAPGASATDLLLSDPTGPAGDAAKAGLADYSKETLRVLQQKLADAGHYKGKLDGDPGPGTLRALAAYWAAPR